MKAIFITVNMEDLRERQREGEVKGEGERERGQNMVLNLLRYHHRDK